MPIAQVVAGARILISDLNAFHNLLKGVSGSGEAITLVYNGTALTFQPSSDPSAGTRVLDIKNAAGTHLASLDFNGVLELLAAAAAPGGAVAGALYWDTLLTALRAYDGTLWQSLATESSANRWRQNYSGMVLPTDSAVTGTGVSSMASNPPFLRLSTGATSGSTVSFRTLIRNGSNWAVGVARRIEFQLNLVNIDANTTAYVLITNESTLNAPSLTANHIGIKNVAGVVSFTTADGATEQATVITTFVTQSQDQTYVVTFDGTTARLYIDGTLRATHATNVPTSTLNQALVWRAYLTNSAASSKIMDIARIESWFATS